MILRAFFPQIGVPVCDLGGPQPSLQAESGMNSGEKLAQNRPWKQFLRVCRLF